MIRVIAALVLVVVLASPAGAELLDTTQEIDIHFSEVGPPAPGVDVVLFELYSADLAFPLDAHFTMSLYDGERLLGTTTPTEVPFSPESHRTFYFSSLTSPFGFSDAAHIDFQAIYDSTIDGTGRITFDQPIDFVPNANGLDRNFVFSFVRSTSPTDGVIDDSTGYLIVDSFSIVPRPVPEPTLFACLLAGAGLACAARPGRRTDA